MVNKFFLRGLGFFNDAYDLQVINIVNIILKHQYRTEYTADMKSNVSTAALIGAVLGQLTFGFLGDMYGRKNCMIATCAILIIGGILTAAAYGGSAHGTLWFLVIARGVLGFGIGGEYPLAASSSSEDATSPADRNRRVSLTFSLQGVGFFTAGILGLIMVNALDETDQNLEIMWRVLFGFGVLPALFLNVLISLVALPGYYVACYFINKMGRKRIMLQGCTVMTVVFLILGIWWDEIRKSSAGFIVLFGLTLFFANFGPNMSTFVMPTEMYPTAIRSSCHGFSAAMGKAGASIGSYGFSLWVDNPSFGYVGTWFTFAGISVLTILLTVFCMFDNNDEASVMDNDFKAKLAMEDDDVRKSFVSQMEEPLDHYVENKA
ncbi:hypothetical protein SDRG_15403 [Saprolegnia diclina VS20]|uniref:Major facilitator superfamily (MFS) profile domain-containing protein n=1 Tax=Saprolegnia diclina (strain VS20) TaxID=1156394 RepID=T0R3Y1_SAPDV|nr:hypothetical protein SDRG_15403 [Saprolegnia diclina VS20]EQC26753.1 hypothetical protein SDRG_15403 [Saprolegnia diclina VS20]|eukprot:XP_008619796.1 hypothetical protein SDRG_15403 [Saprolegnia diclina VS20]